MKRIISLAALFTFTSLSIWLGAQSWTERQKGFVPEASLQHHAQSATVTANDPNPLLQAMTAVREEYGWVVDYEEPPFSAQADLVDSTDPEWRADHPGSPGVVSIAGGFFQSTYPETSDMQAPAGEAAALEKIVSDYNLSGNPGKFRVLREPDGRYVVIGTSIKDDRGEYHDVGSLLETPVSLDAIPRTGAAALAALLKALSLKSGTKCGVLNYGPLHFIHNTLVGGENVPARQLLLKILGNSDPSKALVYEWRYDPTSKHYEINIFRSSKKVHESGISHTP